MIKKYSKWLCLLIAIGVFAFLKFIEYSDTANHHIFYQSDYHWRTYWHFFINWESVLLLAFSLLVGFFPLMITYVIRTFRSK